MSDIEKYVQEFKMISIRGRMAYVLCLFEKLLLHYKCNKKDWTYILEKLWEFTSIEYVDDWMYEVSEILPNSILNDGVDDLEFITENEFYKLRELYDNTSEDIRQMLMIIFELGTADVYSILTEYSSRTLLKLQEAMEILKRNNIQLVDVEKFKVYHFKDQQGWGNCFDGKDLSIFFKIDQGY